MFILMLIVMMELLVKSTMRGDFSWSGGAIALVWRFIWRRFCWSM